MIAAAVKAKTLRIDFWDDECGFTLKPIPCGVPEEYSVFRSNPYQAEHGGMEYGRTLLVKPKSNVLCWEFRSWNLDFLYQPAVSRGQRPDHIIDSYAVYHKTKAHNEYRTGKACHLYRSWAEDSLGARVWCDLRIEGSELRQRLPEWFLHAAHYPVYVDPTFGFTSQGGTEDNADVNFIVAKAFSNPASSGTLDSVSAYIAKNTGTNAQFNPALYADTAGSPSTRLAQVVSGGAALTSTTIALVTQNLSYGSLTSGVQYWFGLSANTVADYKWAFDTGGSIVLINGGGSSFINGWDNPAVVGSGPFDEKVSVYGTFTSSGGGSPVGKRYGASQAIHRASTY